MKKNIMMRLSALLLVAVLLTTCVISGTFAKYVTTSELEEDAATVAKWGIVMTVTGDDVVYDDDKTTPNATAKVLTDALCAPGTYEKITTFTLTGTPEVAYEISVVVDLELTDWVLTDGTTEYCPLVFTVDDTEIKMGGAIDTVDKLEAAVENAIKVAICGDASGVKTYNAGVAVPATANSVLIDWMWAFEGENDKDTQLGDATLNGATQAALDFELQVTVTQVD